MSLHPPVPTPIHPVGWARPAGNTDYMETRNLATHRLLTPGGLGCDFSNELEGAPVYAMDAGTVYQRYIQNTPGQIGHGSLILRLRHPDGASSGYAHMRAFSVSSGQSVTKGQQIAVVGATGEGITGPHLHCDYQKPDGVHFEVYDLLDQNILGDDVNLKGTVLEWIHNRTTHLTGDAGFTEDPTAMPYNNLTILPNGTAFTPSVKVRGNTLVGTDEWYGGWISGNPPQFGYVIGVHVGPLVPIEQAGGLTQAQLDAAVSAAVTPIQIQLEVAKRKITEARTALGG